MKTQNSSLNATQWQARVDKLQKELIRTDEYREKSVGILDELMQLLIAGNRVVDPTLQPALNKLLSAIKEAKPILQITTQSDALSGRIDDLLRADHQKNQHTAATLVALLGQLQDSVPSQESKAIKSLRRDIERARKTHEDSLHQLQHDFLQRYSAIMMAAAGQESGRADVSGTRSTILQKILGWLGSPFTDSGASADSKTAIGSGASEKSPVNKSAQDVQSAADDDNNSDIEQQGESKPAGDSVVDDGFFESSEAKQSALDLSSLEENDSEAAVAYSEITSILLGLLADIDEPESVRALVADLYSRLEQGITESNLVAVLDDSVEVVSQTLKRDQSDFVAFLDDLDSRLHAFNRFVVDLVTELGTNVQGGERLEQEVTEYLDSIRIGVEGASSIDELKVQVGESVEQASSLLSAFVSGQKQSFSALEAQANALQQQVETLQKESERNKQALAQQREKLFRDRLTQIPNREAYEGRIADEFTRWQRYRRPLSYAVADIDFFKSINDNYGHAAGDKVLALVAKIIRSSLRESDFVARYGGEEFVIILPETTLENAKISLEKVREAIVTSPFNFNKQPVPISCSFGVTEFIDGDAVDKVFDRADKALYRAKDGGRNQVVSG